jgi:hypothetical protein
MAALAHVPISRLLLINTSVLLAVFLFLAITPAPVTFPEGAWETLLLLSGGVALLAANIAAARLRSEAKTRRGPRPNTSGEALVEMRHLEHHHVQTPQGVIGIVDEVIGDRAGDPVGLLVVEGWFGSRRALVPLSDIREINDPARTITIWDSSASASIPPARGDGQL